MKTIITICVSLISLFTYCQEGVIISINSDKTVLENGTYIKDIDNEFAPYIGTWQGTFGTALDPKTFSLTIQKVTHYRETVPNGDYNYIDILIGKYIVTDVNSELEIANTMAINNPSLVKITSFYGPHDNRFKFNYDDVDLCNVSLTITLKRNLTNPNELKYYVDESDFWIEENCPYTQKADIPIPIPKTSLVLTKIN